MNKIIVLNNKMNLLYDEVYEYIDNLNKIETDNNIIVCPSSVYLETFINTCNWGIGSQNVYHELSGNYTGELSTVQLKSLGIEYVLIGNSERKRLFNETNSDINLKIKACLDSNIIPIVFLNGDDEEIARQVNDYLKDIEHIEFVIFVYENSEIDVNLDTINEKIVYLNKLLDKKYGNKTNILYSGNINLDDIKEILNISFLNGLVIGSESSKIEELNKIINIIN